jgi:predicted phage terminase large subunit-like protein
VSRRLGDALLDLGAAKRFGGYSAWQRCQALEQQRQRHQLALTPEQNAEQVGSLAQFIRRVSPRFEFYRHVDVLVERLQAVADGQIKRLIIQAPPRHGKSQLTSRLFPAYFLRRHPERWVGLASYGAELADSLSREARQFFTEDGGPIDPASRAVNRWGTLDRGGMWAVGVAGAATGKGFHLGVIDDPVKDANQADSAGYKAAMKDWWDAVYSTRLEPGGAMVVIQTRWALDDLTGFLLSKEDEALDRGSEPERWHVIDLAAIALPQAEYTPLPASCTREPDWRQPGEALCPERYPIEQLRKTEGTMATRWWQALYQQQPTVAGGNLFQREWFRYYDPAQIDQSQIVRTLASLDCTFKSTSGSDFVALTIWSQCADGMFLRDVINQRLGFIDTLALLATVWHRWHFGELLVEDAANGPAVIDTLSRESSGYLIRSVRPLGGKEARANAAAPWYEQGRVWHPTGAGWLQPYEDQLLGFPGAAHDDMVDSTTQVLNYVSGTGPMRVTTASWGRGSEHYTDPKPGDLIPQGPIAPRRPPQAPGFR